MPAPDYRFKVGFSFPGEHREIIEPVADVLAKTFDEAGVLYDKYHDAEFARTDLDIYLPKLYHDETELIVVLLCPEYPKKEWCQLELRHIRQLIVTPEANRIMFLSVGDAGDLSHVGIMRRDGYIRIDALDAPTIASKILKRLAINRGDSFGGGDAGNPPPRLQNLPFTTIGDLFKGREEDLDGLHESLTGEDHHPAAITGRAVHGLGGVGKTRLAVEYAWRYVSEYGALLFAVVESRPEEAAGAAQIDLHANLARLGTVLGLPGHATKQEPDQIAAVLAWLQTNPGWLLILDNADTPAAVDEVEKLLPQLTTGRVLITSRRSVWSEAIDSRGLDSLSIEAAAEFLLLKTEPKPGGAGRTATDTDQADAEALATELDGLALALEQSGAYIAKRRKTIADYLELWRARKAEVQAWHQQHAVTAYPVSLAVTYETTLEQLSDNARFLLDVLAWMAPEPLPQDVLEAEVDGQPLMDDAESLLEELADYSLLQWEGKTVAVHRVLQEVLRFKQEESYPALTKTLELLNASRPEGSSDDVRTWPVWDTLRPHVESATREADELDMGGVVSGLFDDLGVLYFCKAMLDKAEPLMRRALEIDEASYGAQHPEVAIRLNNLAQLLQATNRLVEAEPLMRRALEIDKASYGEQHAQVAIDLNNLAGLLQATNRLVEAEPLMRRALEIDEASYGEPHPRVAIRLNNLAQLLQATNRLVEAEPLMRRALEIDEASYGEQHPQVATDLNNLAGLLQATNRLVEAEPLMRRALEIDEASYGEQHPQVATDLNNLAQLLKATNRLVEAEPLMRRALEIDEASYGAQHPRVAIRLNNLAQLLQATNRLVEAEPLMLRALEIDEASYGAQHPQVAIRLNNLAQLLQATNRLVEAEPLMLRALEIDEASYGEQHPRVAIRLNNLAQLLKATNRLGKAEPLMRRAIDILRNVNKATGHEHPHWQAVRSNYEFLLIACGLAQADAVARVRQVAAGEPVEDLDPPV